MAAQRSASRIQGRDLEQEAWGKAAVLGTESGTPRGYPVITW